MSGYTITPDLKWYEEVTKRKGLKEPRCPFASVEKCPRYYQSLSLLGMAGATGIDEREDKKLQKKWEHHHLWPKTREQETSIGGPEERPHTYSRFCPEVFHEAFGLFADFAARHADELDAELASDRLGERGAPSNDWHWAWQQVNPMHYADCPLYSPLLHDASNSAEKKWWERPVGIVTLGILVTVIGGLILWGITRHYDKVSSPTPAVEQPKGTSSKPGKAAIYFGEGPGTGYALPMSIFESGTPLEGFAGENKIATLKMKPNGQVQLDVVVNDDSGHPVIEIHDDQFSVSRTDLDRNSSKNEFEVVRPDGLVIFQLIRRSPSEVVINGVFTMAGGKSYLLAGPKGALETNVIRYDYVPKPLFKYPSWKFPGQYVTQQ